MAKSASTSSHDRVIIRPLSPVIYLYPTMIAAIICGIVTQLSPMGPAAVNAISATGAAPAPSAVGLIFILLFFFNLTVVAFNYTRLTSVVIVLMGVIVALLGTLYPQIYDVIQAALSQPVYMNPSFYWVWAGTMALVLVAVLVAARFNYWEIRNNELLHHTGLLGDVQRWPAPNMHITKEIKDVMEYALCGAGRLVLMPARADRAIVLDNIPRINRVERRMQELTSTLRVDHVDNDDPRPADEG